MIPTHNERTTSPDESVRGSEQAHININRFEISEKTLSVVALILASIAIGALLIMPSYIDAKVQAGTAKAEATAQTAKEHARVALDKVEQTQVQLGAKGLVQPSTH